MTVSTLLSQTLQVFFSPEYFYKKFLKVICGSFLWLQWSRSVSLQFSLTQLPVVDDEAVLKQVMYIPPSRHSIITPPHSQTLSQVGDDHNQETQGKYSGCLSRFLNQVYTGHLILKISYWLVFLGQLWVDFFICIFYIYF